MRTYRIPPILLALTLCSMVPLAAQTPPGTPGNDGLRGGVFQMGPTFGLASFSDKVQMDSCRWAGVRFGHRFDPFRSAERLQVSFRAGIEGCLTEHHEIGRVDVIHGQITWLLGLRMSDQWRLYWGAGLGELLADSTPSDDNRVVPRFSLHLVPGLEWAPSKRFLFDFSLTGIIFQNWNLGTDPILGTSLGLAPSFFIAVQI